MCLNKIQIHFEKIQGGDLETINFSKYIKQLIENEDFNCGIINIIFCSDKYLLSLNKEYLNHDFYTDIITFDYVEDKVINGDLFISVDRVKENAEKFEEQFIYELFRVIFHGVLHLIGYNDKTEEEQRLMREKENYYLNFFEGEFNDKG